MIKQLDWDSNFFGLKIGKINSVDDINSETELADLIKEAILNFDLTYLFASPEDLVTNMYLEQLGYSVIDKKVTFKKELNPNNEIGDEMLEEYIGSDVTPSLLSMALQSGEYSRFKVDYNFPLNAYERLYTKWIENSVNKVNADHIFVCKEGSELSGFITLAFHSDSSDIGLLAVDEKFRGEGIGKKLVAQAVFTSQQHGLNRIRVVTQLNNKAACSLYEKSGFTIERVEYIYHIWKNKKL